MQASARPPRDRRYRLFAFFLLSTTGSAAPFVSNVTLANCDPSGDCIASTTMNLPGGAHIVEARATFRTP